MIHKPVVSVTTAAAAALFLGFLSGSVVVQAKVNLEFDFDDFPGFRYSEWSVLPNSMLQLAETAGYEESTWNELGSADVESSSWDDLSEDSLNALRQMGFTRTTWDCYINHYGDYTWTDLVLEELSDAAVVMGYDSQTWNDNVTPDSIRRNWDELSNGEQAAAAAFCYFPDTWNGVPVADMSEIPATYPHFRYVLWDDLPASQRQLASHAGYRQDTWNKPNMDRMEYSLFADLLDFQKQAIFALGFYEENYECYENHYRGYSWDQLVEWDLAQYFEAFGWTETLYASKNGPSAWVERGWDDLTDTQKEAADQLCYFEEIWQKETIGEWGGELRFPQVRFTPWFDLTNRQRRLAVTAGYSHAIWDTPGTAALESMVFDALSDEQQDALRALGFYSADQYDCYINHYEALDWDELADYGILEAVETLGWTQSTWDGDGRPAPSQDQNWDELTLEEKGAADQLCYFAETWDKSSLMVWKGVAWPEDRYWPWNTLGRDEQILLESVGFNKGTWDTPGAAAFESRSWDDLAVSQREALREYGFYEEQWDCYMAHYSDYDWFELVLEDVAEYFETLGWTEAMWQSGQEPEIWILDWYELSESEQDAAWELCFFWGTWDEVPLTRWSRHVRSGPSTARAAPRRRSDDSDGRPGLWIFSVVLVLSVVAVGIAYWYKKRQTSVGKRFPADKVPDMTDFSMETEKDMSDDHLPSIT